MADEDTSRLRQAASAVASGAKQTAAQARDVVREQRAKRELQQFRSEEVTDQQEARLERARNEARQEAVQDARQEFREEYREEIKDQRREEELQRLKREAGLDDEQQRDQRDQRDAGGFFGVPAEGGDRDTATGGFGGGERDPGAALTESVFSPPEPEDRDGDQQPGFFF
jgi:hypothetical protein